MRLKPSMRRLTCSTSETKKPCRLKLTLSGVRYEIAISHPNLALEAAARKYFTMNFPCRVTLDWRLLVPQQPNPVKPSQIDHIAFE
jgi:hypothetical protein